MAENSNMPLAGELGLINYLQGLFSNKVANPNYTGGTVPAPVLAPTMSGQDMSNIMTEFLRGNGQFMDQMRQQNLSGLYNSSTQRLVANDLTAQAALKASLANQNIQQGNAQILNNYNARVAAQAPKYLPNQAGGAGKALAALGVAGLQKLLEGDKGKGKGTKTTKTTDTAEEGANTGGSFLDNITEKFNEIFSPATESSPISVESFVPAGISYNPESFMSDAVFSSPQMSFNPGLDLNFENTSFEDYSFTPDTYESFFDSYNTAPGYNFQDYDEYFFD